VPVSVARERNRVLRELAAEKKNDFMRSFVDAVVHAITLRARSEGPVGDQVRQGDFTEALTDNYLKVRLEGHHEANQWVNARVHSLEGDELVGTLVA